MSLYRDARALDTGHGRLPNTMPHRDAELGEISNALGVVESGGDPRPIRITGPSGVGKTTLARFAVERLKKQHPNVSEAFVDVMDSQTATTVLYQILLQLGRSSGVGFRDPAPVLFEELSRVAEGDETCIIILDEVSRLDPDAHYLLRKLPNLPSVGVILVGQGLDSLFAELDPGITSRYHRTPELSLDSYSVNELADILSARARAAFADTDRIDEDAIELMAEVAEGDARTAINTLRSAAEHIRGEGDEITVATVHQVAAEAREMTARDAYQSVDTDHRTVVRIVLNEPGLTGPQLHTRTQSELDREMSARTHQRWVAYLTEKGLIEKHGKTKGATYHPTDVAAALSERIIPVI
mgnify:CR=1 FL=1